MEKFSPAYNFKFPITTANITNEHSHYKAFIQTKTYLTSAIFQRPIKLKKKNNPSIKNHDSPKTISNKRWFIRSTPTIKIHYWISRLFIKWSTIYSLTIESADIVFIYDCFFASVMRFVRGRYIDINERSSVRWLIVNDFAIDRLLFELVSVEPCSAKCDFEKCFRNSRTSSYCSLISIVLEVVMKTVRMWKTSVRCCVWFRWKFWLGIIM